MVSNHGIIYLNLAKTDSLIGISSSKVLGAYFSTFVDEKGNEK